MVEENKDALGIARLQVQLENVLAQITVISTNMVTKDLFTAQNQSVEFRFNNIEQQQNANRTDSIKEIAKVDADAKARDLDGANATLRAAKEITDRLDKSEERQYQIEERQKEQKNSKWTSVGVTVLGGLLTIVTSVVLIFINNGITPGN